MGEARAKRRREAREAGQPFELQPSSPAVPRVYPRLLNIPGPLNHELERELYYFRLRLWNQLSPEEQKAVRTPEHTVTRHDYLIAHLEASVERERLAREAAEQVAKPEQMVQLVTHVPAGMEGIAEKLQALKTGSMPAQELVRG